MGSKILLADDSITIQKVVNLTFSDEGIEVVAVSNGDVAERRLEEVSPDLVLADIFMPGKNGYELCESIKQNPQFRNVPVVLLVGAFEPFDQAEARRVRADAHLTKPFESRTLVETVRRLINASAHSGVASVAAMTPAGEPRDDNGGRRDSGPITAELPAGRLTAPSSPKLDLSAMMADTSAQSTVSVRSTGELSSRIGDFRTEAFDVTVAGASARESLASTLIDTDQPFETMEFASSEFTSEDVSAPLGFDQGEPILDFERSELFEWPAHQPELQEDISFETLPDVESSQSSSPPMHFEMNVESAFEAPNDNGGASLLAADEPLGDVLDEASPIEPPFQDVSANDSLNLELAELETVAPATETQFDLIDTPDSSSSQASAEAEEQPEKQAAEHQATPSFTADWTSPRAGAYSTAQLDSVVMPMESSAYLGQDSPKESERSEASQQASFTPPARWTEEEARFAAIDIEAVPVDEQNAQLDSDVSDEPPQYVETPAVNAAEQPANGASSTSELSAAAIEEIVRRVIAEMSDSVVREVAWEVVPDCVERIVDQLTRESLSKPT